MPAHDPIPELTILITTSPLPMNPSLGLLEFVLRSMSRVPGLMETKKVIVCDGCKVRTRFGGGASESLWRAGQVTKEALVKYEEYIEALRERVEHAPADDCFHNTEVLVLDERQGFGFAVKEGLKAVQTRFTMVVQHDRNFKDAEMPDIPGLLDVMREHGDSVKCVCLACAPLLDYVHRMKSRFQADVSPMTCRLKNGDRLVPMLQWLDSTHVADTEWYRSFVFDPARKLVKKGGFIEDKFGQEQVKQLRDKGFPEGWAPFKNWLYCEKFGTATGYVEHLDARGLTQDGFEKLCGGSPVAA